MLNYKFIGWCHEDNHDKVWICIEMQQSNWETTYLTCWGRRGKKLQTKLVTDTPWTMEKLIDSKERKGYNRVASSKLNEVYPEFEDDLSKTAFWAMFKV